jgi:hypothetical protein
VRWQCGLVTYLPVAGSSGDPVRETLLAHYVIILMVKKDVETEAVLDMASRPCLGRGPSEPEPGLNTDPGNGSGSPPGPPLMTPTLKSNSVQENEMVVTINLEYALRRPDDANTSNINEKLQVLLDTIHHHIANSRSVVLRGWRRDLPFDLSNLCFQQSFGDLGQPIQWQEGFQFAKNRAYPHPRSLPYHRTTTLKYFLDTVEDPTICGNWLDGKNMSPNPPSVLSPILDSTSAWNMTFNLRAYVLPKKSRSKTKASKKNRLELYSEPPFVVAAANWSSPGWRLVTHPGAVTFPHNDCCGLCTYVVADAGCKIWAVMRQRQGPNQTWEEKVADYKDRIRILGDDNRFDCDMVTVVLEEGDIM